MTNFKYDFSGWATRNDMLCSDGRTIRKDAFKDCDGKTVPLVWNHGHNDPDNVLGQALLHSNPEGVRVYGAFNDTESGVTAKKLVQHGDITSLSIYANQLKQNGGDVVHGNIREVSLVLAGANPGAFIDEVVEHGEDGCNSAVIFNDADEDISLEHGEITNEKKEEDGKSMSEDNNEYDDNENNSEKETVQDVIDTMNEKQKNVLYALVGMAIEGKLNPPKENNEDEEEDKKSSEAKHSDYTSGIVTAYQKGFDAGMKHNVFDENTEPNEDAISHSDIQDAINDFKRFGSMRESFKEHGLEDIAIAHADTEGGLPISGSATYGIDHLDYLFPDARNVSDQPRFIQRDTAWVGTVMNGTTHTPFSRIKSTFADITDNEARAKGYLKGKLKKEEVFTLLKRTTTPTTVYKKQKMDRDDIIDITDFDVIAWLKSEMRVMLDEEIARAILVGDGRQSSSDDKINEQNIRPIWTDEDLYTIKATVDSTTANTSPLKAKAFITSAVRSRKDYKGSGTPTLFIGTDILTECLLLEDTQGYRLYKNENELAQAMRVANIVEVPVFDGLTRTVESKTHYLMGIIVNIRDYTVGADRGGAVSMFDDFDIDYNQQKYLIETRCSGALTVPYSAIAIELV